MKPVSGWSMALIVGLPALPTRKRGDASIAFEASTNNAPASWTAVTSEAKSALWLVPGGSVLLASAHLLSESVDSTALRRRSPKPGGLTTTIYSEVRRRQSRTNSWLL